MTLPLILIPRLILCIFIRKQCSTQPRAIYPLCKWRFLGVSLPPTILISFIILFNLGRDWLVRQRS